MARKYWSYYTNSMKRVRIPHVSFRRNGPRNTHDPLAIFQSPPTWHYTFIDNERANQ